MNTDILKEITRAMNAYAKVGKHKPDAELCTKTMGGIMILRSHEHGYIGAVKDGKVLNG